MALEPHLWKPARFGGNLRQGKDTYAGLPIDARSASSSEAGSAGREAAGGEEPHANKRCALTLISANEACTGPVL